MNSVDSFYSLLSIGVPPKEAYEMLGGRSAGLDLLKEWRRFCLLLNPPAYWGSCENIAAIEKFGTFSEKFLNYVYSHNIYNHTFKYFIRSAEELPDSIVIKALESKLIFFVLDNVKYSLTPAVVDGLRNYIRNNPIEEKALVQYFAMSPTAPDSEEQKLLAKKIPDLILRIADHHKSRCKPSWLPPGWMPSEEIQDMARKHRKLLAMKEIKRMYNG